MSQEAIELQPQPVLNLIAWTLGPTALFIVVIKTASLLQVSSRVGVALTLLVLAAAGVTQCMAFQKSRGMIRTKPLLARAFGYLCAIFSTIQIFLWFLMLMFVGYYALHPNAPMVFGGG
jgi:hypothetical protein